MSFISSHRAVHNSNIKFAACLPILCQTQVHAFNTRHPPMPATSTRLPAIFTPQSRGWRNHRVRRWRRRRLRTPWTSSWKRKAIRMGDGSSWWRGRSWTIRSSCCGGVGCWRGRRFGFREPAYETWGGVRRWWREKGGARCLRIQPVGATRHCMACVSANAFSAAYRRGLRMRVCAICREWSLGGFWQVCLPENY
jgi:hypothetical protein